MGLKRNAFLCNAFLFTVSTLLSIGGAYAVAENYFFDVFFYQKSLKHGYWVRDRDLSLEDFGRRSKDLQSLYQKKLNDESAAGVYTIAIISDSFGWGPGLKESQRFSSILEKYLNRERPTNVLSLSFPGDSIIDYYNNYKLASSQTEIDLFIFGLVENDLIFRKKYEVLDAQKASDSIIQQCQAKPIQYDYCCGETPGQVYENEIKNVFTDNYGNLCVLKLISRLLPKDRSLYFDYGWPFDPGRYMSKLLTPLKSAGLRVISLIDANPDSFDFSRLDKFFVSDKESHPSAYSNKLFADKLYFEITTNPDFGFIN